MRSYFWPFTEVQNGNQREVMRKNAETLRTTDYADVTDGLWLASDTDALQLDARFDAPGLAIAGRRTVFYLCYPWSGKLFQLG